VRLVAVVAIAACSGGESPGSGVPRNTPLVMLTDAEITKLCTYTVGLGPITGDCGNGEHVTIGKLTVDECFAQYVQRRELFTSCTATVGDVEDCTVDFLPFTPQMLCKNPIDFPPPCVVVFTEVCGGL